MGTDKIKATVEILTYNSASTLRAALESVKDFAEILVIDGRSTDDTRLLADEYGARVLEQDKQYLNDDGTIADFGGIRNQGLEASSCDWMFVLDSDETASEALIARLRTIVAEERSGAYWVMRRYVYRGKEIDCSTSYPNRQIRFFHKAAVTRFKKPIHERIVVRSSVSAGTLNEAIKVPVSIDGRAAYEKSQKYLTAEVDRLATLGTGVLVSGVAHGLRGLLAFCFRFIWMMLFCRGRRLPVSHELRALRYQAELAVRCAWRLIARVGRV